MKKDNSKALKQTIGRLFSAQKLAVLSTYGNGQPYASLVAFASSEDLKTIFFATTRSTRKYANLEAEPKVALLIDSRSNREEDFCHAMAVTVLGTAKEADQKKRGDFLALYLAKHPYLREFVTAPSTALLRVEVERFYIVDRFQNVLELRMK